MTTTEPVAVGGGGERKEFDVEATGGDNEGLEEGVSCHAADVSKPKGSITIVPPQKVEFKLRYLCPHSSQIEAGEGTQYY